jgi:hypothetical protein
MDGPLATYYPVPAGGLGVLTVAISTLHAAWSGPGVDLKRWPEFGSARWRNTTIDAWFPAVMAQLCPTNSYFYLGIFHDIFHQLVIGVISFHLQLLVGPLWILNRIHNESLVASNMWDSP